MELRCITCNADLSTVRNSTKFNCPECGEQVNRCGTCRISSKKWKCKCGFGGP